jgi:tRNA(adenine34) deaminase
MSENFESLMALALEEARQSLREGNSGFGAVIAQASEVFLQKLNLSPEDAPIASRNPTRLVIRSQNFCPTLEACKILGLDTRRICARLTERPMDALLKQVDPHLTFSRNYDCIRPQAEYCEEVIRLDSWLK